MNKGTLFVFTGPSGTGKGTVLAKVLPRLEKMHYSVSATTRAPREGEIEGKSYYFISLDEFHRMIAENKLLEYACFAGNYYGTPSEPIDRNLNAGNDVILEIELQGALQIKKIRDDAVFIFMAPPSMEELEKRLRNRGTEDEEHLQMRLAKAREECAAEDQFDHVIINDIVDRVSDELYNIILSYRNNISGGQQL